MLPALTRLRRQCLEMADGRKVQTDLMLRLAQAMIQHLVDTSQSVMLQCCIFQLALKP
jgi:hypothetical protein